MKKVALLTALLGLTLTLGACGNSSDSSSKESSVKTEKASAHKTTDKEKSSSESKSSSAKKTVEVGYQNYDVQDEKQYNVNFTDTSWSAAVVKVNKVTVYKLAKPAKYESANDGTFDANGFVRLHVIVTPNQDISAYPTQGTAVYSNGEQHDVDSGESWDGDIAKGATKEGDVTIPVKNLANTSELKNVRFKFDADYETDNIDDDNAYKTYDTTINLN